jgi:hypothetical protein
MAWGVVNGRTSYGSDSLLATLPAQVDFNFHVKPILSDRCFACHGPDANKREGNLRLDTEAGAFAALDSLGERHAIVAGDLGSSELFGRITSKDPELMMPPPNSNLKLSESEVALLAKWIDQGAQWKEHWSFTAPQKPELPAVKAKNWVKTPLDYYVLKRLEDKGLQPSTEAPRETLLRRAAFDLTGLPPSVAEVDAFLKDTSPTPTRRPWTACWPRPTTANGWPPSGSTWPATPTRTATRTTACATPGPGASG